MTTEATSAAARIFDLDRDGLQIVRSAITPRQRTHMLDAARRLLASPLTRGRDRGSDGKDGFRGVVDLDEAFLPLLDTPPVLRTVADLLGPNIHVLSSHLIALPSHATPATRTIRTPQRPGWHRDMYGVTTDLGLADTPRLAIKAAYYLSGVGPDTGTTMFLPRSHHAPTAPVIRAGRIDPPGAITPGLDDGDAVLFENRTWHAGGLNTSGRPRIAVIIQYGYRGLGRVDDPPIRLTPDREDLTPLQRQLLGAPGGARSPGVFPFVGVRPPERRAPPSPWPGLVP